MPINIFRSLFQGERGEPGYGQPGPPGPPGLPGGNDPFPPDPDDGTSRLPFPIKVRVQRVQMCEFGDKDL